MQNAFAAFISRYLLSLGPHFIRTLLVVGEVAAQVVLVLVVLHQL